MIPPLAGWTALARERDLLLVADDAPEAARIRYQERVRPLLGPIEVVRDYCLSLPGVLLDLSAPRPVVTREGEHGILVEVKARRGGHDELHVLGVVPIDDFYALTVGVARDRSCFERVARAVASLVERDEHYLGARLRRFPFTPPAGWRRSRRLGTLRFAAPDGELELSVPYAHPLAPGAPLAAYLDGHGVPGSGLAVEGRVHVCDVARPAEGRVWSLTVTRTGEPGWVRAVALLRDRRYVYDLHVDARRAHAARAEHVLLDVVATVGSLFPARPGAAAATSALCHWVD